MKIINEKSFGGQEFTPLHALIEVNPLTGRVSKARYVVLREAEVQLLEAALKPLFAQDIAQEVSHEAA
ncbi:MAG: hypothetical protein IPJ69_02020 [Deltaproteobacteria bacterium]|nr:MAG: hypothetical protein IPJ69_02020 [Deltaproteobacteria bacterium]